MQGIHNWFNFLTRTPASVIFSLLSVYNTLRRMVNEPFSQKKSSPLQTANEVRTLMQKGKVSKEDSSKIKGMIPIIKEKLLKNKNATSSHSKKMREECAFLQETLDMVKKALACKKPENKAKCQNIEKELTDLIDKQVMYVDDYTSLGDIMQRIKDL